MIKQFAVRHGDVLVIRVNEIPKEAKAAKRDGGRLILAYGEITFHSHAIIEKTAKGFLSGDDLYLDLSKKAMLTHEEHETIELAPGRYRVVHQVEYRRKELVKVID